MDFDPLIGKLILFGGQDSSDIQGDTWAFDGSIWTKLLPALSPSPRINAPIAFDPAIGRLVLFGGHDNLGHIIGDTWTFDGAAWTQLSPPTSPPARWLASMAYDPAIGQLVLFGGYDEFFNALSDTWAFDGTTWTELSPPASPAPRICASMTFDPATDMVVLFGGGSPSAGWFSDTWGFDGTTWTQLTPPQSPSARLCASLAFDPTTSDLVLFGGFFPDTWSFDGTTWTDVSPTTSPVARNYAPLAFDPPVGQLVLFGGSDTSGNFLSDTWTFGRSAIEVTSVTPAALGQGATVVATITSSGFSPGAAVSVSGSGVSVGSTTFGTSTKLKAQITVAADALVGPRDVTVVGSNGSATCSGCLLIDAGPKPTSVSPNGGSRGTTERVAIAGSGFQPGAQVRFGLGVTVNAIRFLSSGLLKASITIAPDAATGSRTVGVVNLDGGQGSCIACFTVS